MRYSWEPGVPSQLLSLHPSEVALLRRILARRKKEVLSRYYKYKDIHESGEATERQQNLFFQYEEEYEFIAYFMSMTENDDQ